jgi:hypothetical protein
MEALQAHFLQTDRQGPETPVVQAVLVLLALLEIRVLAAAPVQRARLLLGFHKHFPEVLLVMAVRAVMVGRLVMAVLVEMAAAAVM